MSVLFAPSKILLFFEFPACTTCTSSTNYLSMYVDVAQQIIKYTRERERIPAIRIHLIRICKLDGLIIVTKSQSVRGSGPPGELTTMNSSVQIMFPLKPIQDSNRLKKISAKYHSWALLDVCFGPYHIHKKIASHSVSRKFKSFLLSSCLPA